MFQGDSITHSDTYRRICERVFRHFHPEGNVEFIQAGVWGSSSSDLVKRLQEQKRKPTVVSMMLGMNNAINGGWVKGMPREANLKAYRNDIEQFVRKSRADGAAVILMSPTLTDDSCRQTFFRIDGAIDFLQDCRKIVQEVAAAEGAYYVPVQEEFEAFQNTLDHSQKLRPDGVHPSSLGEYQIARSLWEHLNFAGALSTKPDRALSDSPSRLPWSLQPASPRVSPDSKGVSFNLVGAPTAAAEKAQITWSLDDQRGTSDVALATGSTWQLAPAGLPKLKAGDDAEAVIELRAGNRSALSIVDLCPVPVLHFKDDAVSSTISDPAGKPVATWTARRADGELLIDVDVTDGQIESASKGPFAMLFQRDGLGIVLDFRDAKRFGDINLDTDVIQAFVNYQEKPFVAAALHPWLGTGFASAAMAGCEKLPQGYRIHLRVSDSFDIRTPLAIDSLDYIGLNLEVRDATRNAAGAVQMATYSTLTTQYARDQYANNIMILDLKQKIPGDSTMNIHVFPPVALPALVK